MEARRIFKSVKPLPDWRLEIEMETGSTIYFDFTTRLNTARFGALLEEGVFESVRTDGKSLLFYDGERERVNIQAQILFDLLAIDRTR